ncbi:hypothetical protein F2Q65_15470 [Thiohalocapsa marina]|uniref:Uncharacterized protein n=1 Tax=Thiohalocapsa marina TaxID=424902 RepID=A0A5M8FFW7_9GAMM|nr:hypothetical protein [Thiohalocapsa marina]KAA6183589.1 hypothetical protein F2Q65_15470 [Thiohalocapsa marina]
MQTPTPIPAPTSAQRTSAANPGIAYSAGDRLRMAVAVRCAARTFDEDQLSALVAELQARGVHPGEATEALLWGNCGRLERVVRELVAQGGTAAMPWVVERAIDIAGGESAVLVDLAAAEGLAKYRRGAGRGELTGRGRKPTVGEQRVPVLAHFPPRPLQPSVPAAVPGYGLYTHVLFAGPAAQARGRGVDGGDELLRVIETYVLEGESRGPGLESVAGSGPDPAAHTFLVPVYADVRDAGLVERANADLSAQLLTTLVGYLDAADQPELARRLRAGRGPFLVSGLEPSLLPGTPDAARMVVDLGSVGPEYMYSVVDAYDRRIAPELLGRPESLMALRDRLVAIFPSSAIDARAGAPADDWIAFLGGTQEGGGTVADAMTP